MKNVIFICLLAISCSTTQSEIPKNVTGERKTLVLIEKENNTRFFKAKSFYTKALKIEKKADAAIANKGALVTVLKFEYNKALTFLQKARALILNIKTFNWSLWKKKLYLQGQINNAIKRIESISLFLSVDWATSLGWPTQIRIK